MNIKLATGEIRLDRLVRGERSSSNVDFSD